MEESQSTAIDASAVNNVPVPAATDPRSDRRDALKMSAGGMTYAQIGQKFGISKGAVRDWLTKARQEFRESIESAQAGDYLAEALLTVNTVGNMAAREIQEMRDACTEIDDQGVRRRKRGFDHLANGKYLEILLKSSTDKVAVLKKVGVLPNEISKMKQSIKDSTYEEAAVEEQATRTHEEVEDNIRDLLSKVRSLK